MTPEQARKIPLKFGDEQSLEALRVVEKAESLKRGQHERSEGYIPHVLIEQMEEADIQKRINQLILWGEWRWDDDIEEHL